MKRLAAFLLLAFLLAPVPALAQATRDQTVSVVVSPPATEAPVSTATPSVDDRNTVTVLGMTFSLDPGCLLEGIVVGTNHDLSGGTVTVRTFQNTLDGWEPVPPFTGAASGDFANASVGDQSCLIPKGH